MRSDTSRTATKDWKWRRREAIIRDDYACQKCGAQGGRKGDTQLHVHHIKPVAEGGSDDLENLETLCSSCHRSRHADEAASNPGHFEKEFFDEDFLDAVSAVDGATTNEVAEAVGCKYRTAYARLGELEDEGTVTGRKVGNSLVWMLVEGDESEG